MSGGAVAAASGSTAIPFLLFAAALLALLDLLRGGRSAVRGIALDRLADRALPRSPRARALLAGLAIAVYVVAAAGVIGATRYHSDAVVAAQAGAERVVAGRHPYAGFDLVAELARFGLPPTYATALEDGTRSRSLQYPALAVLVPAPFIAAGLADVRVLYLAEVLAIFALVVLRVAPRWRAVTLVCCLGNLAVPAQFVDAGVDPAWALLVLAAWALRRRPRLSAVALGLAVAARQPAWLVAPFMIAWAWRELGRRDALERAAIALGVAVIVHVPFLLGAPLETLRGISDPALLPLEAWGVGPAKLAADGIGPLLPRAAYLAAATAAYLAGLWAVAAGRVRAGGAPLTLALLPLWLSWRALQSYFAFLPLFALSGEDTSEARDAASDALAEREASRYDRA